MDRRDLVKGFAAAAALLSGSTPTMSEGAAIHPAGGQFPLRGKAIRFVDLTHRLTRSFNFTPDRLAMQATEGSGAVVGMRVNRVTMNEHTGTHFDAPSHFDPAGCSLGEIPLQDLIVPLVVLDISEKVATDPNGMVQPEDIAHWERQHGRMPDNCCVAMNSGWDPLLPANRDFNRGRPGFSVAAAELLIARRKVKGIAVDSMSLDNGANTPDYPVHIDWLRSGRWGIEGIANLALVPARDAILVVGAPPVAGATGFPVRAIALF